MIKKDIEKNEYTKLASKEAMSKLKENGKELFDEIINKDGEKVHSINQEIYKDLVIYLEEIAKRDKELINLI